MPGGRARTSSKIPKKEVGMFVVCLLLIRMWVSILLSSNAYFFWLVTSRHASGVHVDVRAQ